MCGFSRPTRRKISSASRPHVLTIPVFIDVTAESVGLCVFDLLGQSCDVWGSEDNLPFACLALSAKVF